MTTRNRMIYRIAYTENFWGDYAKAIGAPAYAFDRSKLKHVAFVNANLKYYVAQMYTQPNGRTVYFIEIQRDDPDNAKLVTFSDYHALTTAVYELKYGGIEPEHSGTVF